jgi:ribosome-associated protein
MQVITTSKFNQKKQFNHLEQNTLTVVAGTETLLNNIIEAIKDKKGEHLISLDLRKIEEAVAKYFVICDAQTTIQTAAIVANVVSEVQKETAEIPYHIEESSVWSIIDYADIVVHIFRTEERKFYDLEGAWMDAQKKEYT